ncbi:MAG TPA: helix-turn-helix transcriptional regulator [Verrucomicrobiae bacterium]|nr:helix-turn-helix transcriptional regulator [Verrucomicrobiae bacterium]
MTSRRSQSAADEISKAKPRSLSSFLYQKRKELGLSLREMAEKLGVSPALLSQMESGIRFPSDETLVKMARNMEVQRRELRRFNTRSYLEDLRHIIIENPDLGFVLFDLICEFEDGNLKVQDLVAALKDFTKQPNAKAKFQEARATG